MTDVIVVGGGVIGLSIAYELAGQGLSVTLLEQGVLGGEASWAGAGMLPPGNSAGARDPEARLRAASHVLWPALSDELRELTGIDNGYRRTGGLELSTAADSARVAAEVEAWRAEGVRVQPLSGTDLQAAEPALSSTLTNGYLLPELGQVRNPRHLKALAAGCAARGVQLHAGTPVLGFQNSGSRIVAVRTPAGALAAQYFVLTAGAWSRSFLEDCGCRLTLQPIRGQIVLLNAVPLPFHRILQVGSRYLVPRPDGRILIGSTEEAVGFDKRNTAAGVRGLLDFALEVVPGLAAASLERTWAGLRPGSCDGLPYLGRVPNVENLLVAAGHFRSGLQMSPITAVLISQLLRGVPTTIPLEPYACDRGSKM